MDISALEAAIKMKFTNTNYIIQALTHSSYANEQQGTCQSNERLEFLGDAVLELIVSELLYKYYPDLTEGELTRLRAGLVCESALVEYAQVLQLGKFLRLGKGEELSGGRRRPALLADAFEALLGAIYLDQDLETAKDFMIKFLDNMQSQSLESFVDYKTQLQELLQQYHNIDLSYALLAAEGPDHDKTFRAGVYINDEKVASGVGKTKKDAEQAAARRALAIVEGRFKK
ncbi:MAG: ribonuclease III [Firmicutes bacterium]|nr:ribonuclease III [Bacillota bacterium]